MADITAHELSVEILHTVNNGIFTFDNVVKELDEGYGNISHQVLLPRLKASTEVETVLGANVADLPTNHQRELHFCYSVGQEIDIKVFNDKSDIIRRHGDPAQAGDVKGVAVFGTSLYYQGIPAVAETLKIDYYKIPDTINARTSIFAGLPPHLIRPLLVNFGSFKLFSILEQGKEGKPNTIHYTNLYMAALKTLYDAYPKERFRS